MANSKKLPPKFQVWADARRRFHLSHAQIQMARELGLNPKKFGSLANHKQEPWKAPLPEFIESLYFKRFGQDRPAVVRTVEDCFAAQRAKREERKARRQQEREIRPSAVPDGDLPEPLF